MQQSSQQMQRMKKIEVVLGKNVVVLGGGNTAMDVARAAIRVKGVENVRLVYRRTKRYMPADEEELREAIEDGVQFMELLAPIGVENGQLKCSVMELGEADESGRRAPVDTGKVEYVPADTVIAAVGENIDGTLYEDMGVELDRKGRPVVDANMMTSVEGVYAAGDSRRGPATVVEAIADASKAAAAIAGISYEKYAEANVAEDSAKYIAKKGYQVTTSQRCQIRDVLDVLLYVRHVQMYVQTEQTLQLKLLVNVVNRLSMQMVCNECGNCAVFCPYAGRPYKDKFTLFWSEEDFTNSENEGFYCEENGEIHLRLDGKVEKTDINGIRTISADAAAVIETIQKDYSYLMKQSCEYYGCQKKESCRNPL